MQVSGIVNAPSTVSNADLTQPIILMGKAAEFIVAELHGKWYTASYRGKLFHGATTITGQTLTTQSTTVSAFMLYNLLGSGVNVEMIGTDVAMLAGTQVAGSILQTAGTATITSPTSTVIVLISANPFNGAAGTAQAKLTTAATLSGANSFFYPLFNIVTTTNSGFGQFHYDWDGKLIIAPGSNANLSSNPTQTAVSVCGYDWAEWPV